MAGGSPRGQLYPRPPRLPVASNAPGSQARGPKSHQVGALGVRSTREMNPIGFVGERPTCIRPRLCPSKMRVSAREDTYRAW